MVILGLIAIVLILLLVVIIDFITAKKYKDDKLEHWSKILK